MSSRKQQPRESRGNSVQIPSLILNHPDTPPAPHLRTRTVPLLPQLTWMVLTGKGADTATTGLAGHTNHHAPRCCELLPTHAQSSLVPSKCYSPRVEL